MIELYQFEECPYCSKVRTKLTDLKVDFIAKNVNRNRPDRKRVIEISGQPGVPVLVDGDKVIIDSEKIVQYLEEKYGRS